MSLSRNDSSTAFLSHWLTDQSPFAPFSATRAAPRSSRSSAVSTASRTGPLVDGTDAVALFECVVDGLGELGVRHGMSSAAMTRVLSRERAGDVKAAATVACRQDSLILSPRELRTT